MNQEINKYLTEAMGLCWHEFEKDNLKCSKCTCTTVGLDGNWVATPDRKSQFHWTPCTYFSWQGFGRLWEWAIKQKWWREFVRKYTYIDFNGIFTATDYIIRMGLSEFINPEKFSSAIYNFLKEAEE